MCGIFALIEETKVDPKNENDVLNNYKYNSYTSDHTFSHYIKSNFFTSIKMEKLILFE